MKTLYARRAIERMSESRKAVRSGEDAVVIMDVGLDQRRECGIRAYRPSAGARAAMKSERLHTLILPPLTGQPLAVLLQSLLEDKQVPVGLSCVSLAAIDERVRRALRERRG